MRASVLMGILAGAALVAIGAPALAHHSFSAEFDNNKRITLTGVVTKVEWMNPHTYFYIDVKDPATGKVTNWGCEMGSPNGLVARGWTRDTLKVGMVVTVPDAATAKNGTNKCNGNSVRFADGRQLDSDSSSQNPRTQ